VIRRVLVGTCLAGAVWLVVLEVRPPPPPAVRVVTAAAPVEAGAVLAARDLTTSDLPVVAVQPGALTSVDDAVGRTTASALAAGETLTRTRLAPRSPAEGLRAGEVALHVVLADPSAADVLYPGQDVLVFPTTGGPALARGGAVLATDPPLRESVPGLGAGGTRGVLLALPAGEAEAVLAGHGGLEGPVVVNLVATGGS
jgi:SAF domain